MNKQENSKLRNLNLTFVPDYLKSYVFELEKTYGKYCYMPLAIPVIFDDKIIDWFEEHRKAITKVKADMADPYYGYSLFNSVNVCLDPAYKVKDPIWTNNDYDTFDKDFPHFYQQMMDLLPLSKIPRFSFWKSTNKIAPHRDHSCLIDLPNSFRIMITDNNPSSTLYVYEESDTFVGDKTYVHKMADTNTFVWNNLRVLHGSDYDANYSKILLIINNFIPDYKKYGELLEKSASEYADKILVSNQTIDDFI